MATSNVNRTELVRHLVLTAISDDYENLEMIHQLVAKRSSRCGLSISISEIIRALGNLIEAGFASPYQLSGTAPPQVMEGRLSPGQFEDFYTYFLTTQKGMELLRSDRSSWPFDEQDLLKEDWSPPEE